MGSFRPIPTKCWVEFLKSRNCIPNSINSSHHKWKCPGCFQSIIFWGNEKEIPFAHISTNLKTMGVSKAEFLIWAKENC